MLSTLAKGNSVPIAKTHRASSIQLWIAWGVPSDAEK